MKMGNPYIFIVGAMIRTTFIGLVSFSFPRNSLSFQNVFHSRTSSLFTRNCISQFSTTAKLPINPQQPPVFDINSIIDCKRRLIEVSKRIEEYTKSNFVQYEQLEPKIRDLEIEITQEGFWDNQSKAQRILSELTKAKETVGRVKKWKTQEEDTKALLELVAELPLDESIGISNII